jgi:uncharacterized protein YndB with AHSA1/START domain
MEPFVISTIAIDAPIAKVWEALIHPEQTKQYMFGCAAISDWRIGSPLLWIGVFDGVEITAVKGYVVQFQPESIIEYSVFDPNSSTLADVPENYLNVTYLLSTENNQTILEVRQGDFTKVVDGQKRYDETYNNGEGWNPILAQIKAMVEARME